MVGAACSSSGDSASPTTIATPTTAAPSGPVAVPLPEGFPSTVVMTLGDQYAAAQRLVAIDVASGAQTVLAEQAVLATGVGGDRARLASIVSVALMPDGQVSFAFGYDTWQLFEVPIDGSTPARLVIDLDDSFAYPPSPDGRWLPIYDERGLRLIPADGASAPRPSGVALPYGVGSPVWSPDGTLLAAFPHYERSAPPPLVAYTVDPATGVLREAEEAPDTVGVPAGNYSGQPWYDASGQLHVAPQGSTLEGAGTVVLTSLGADTTHRWVIGVAGQYSGQGSVAANDPSQAWLVWWEAADATPVPHLLDLGVDLPNPLVTSVSIAAAF
jgi:hypothetical protein